MAKVTFLEIAHKEAVEDVAVGVVEVVSVAILYFIFFHFFSHFFLPKIQTLNK